MLMSHERVWTAGAIVLCAAAAAPGAQRLVATMPLADFQIGDTPVSFNVPFAVSDPIHGIGLTGDWTADVADTGGGLFPWALDLAIRVTAPDGVTQQNWAPIGGDRTIAAYPLQDGAAGLPGVSGTGTFAWEFRNAEINPGEPWVMGLSNVQVHLTTDAPEIVTIADADVTSGPQWDRPFFIAGISGLGPVFYEAIEFEVSVSGLYSFESVVSTNSAFNFLYRDGFDPNDQLTNLLDYGLGNGNAPNETPNGTSFIEAMLFEGQSYTFIVSQWASFVGGQTYTTTITGPGTLMRPAPCPGDANGDGLINFDDLNAVLEFWNTAVLAGDVDGSGYVDFDDLNAVLFNWDTSCP